MASTILTLRVPVNAGVPRAPDPPPGAKVPNQFLFQRSPRLVFPFGQRQRTQAAATHRRSDPAVTRQQEMDDMLVLTECSTNRI